MNKSPDGCQRYRRLLWAGWLVTVLTSAHVSVGAEPAWWSTVKNTAPASDYSIANQGQAKWFALKAEDELMAKLPPLPAPNDGPIYPGGLPPGDNYAPINQGQLKNLVKPLYDRIKAAQTANPSLIITLPQGMVGDYPWSEVTTDDQNYAPVNLGQLKYALSFEFTGGSDGDSDGDGLPDVWELQYFGNLSASQRGDADGDGLTDGEEYRLDTIPNQADVAPPVVNPPGGIYVQPQMVSISCYTEGATIRYTLDGTEPTVTSTLIASGTQLPAQIATATTLKVKAWKDGATPSRTTTASYTFGVASPYFVPGGGAYAAGQTVEMYSPTEGSTIRYTTDGTEPTDTSTEYSVGSPVTISSTTTLKARSWKGTQQSGTATAHYTIRSAPPNDMFVNRRVLSGASGITRGSNIGGSLESAEVCNYSWEVNNYACSVWFEWTAPVNAKVVFDLAQRDFDYHLSVFTGNSLGDCLETMIPIADGIVSSDFGVEEEVSFDAIAGQTYRIALTSYGYYSVRSGNYALRWYPVDQVETPLVSNLGGTFKTSQTVKLTCDTPESVIRYTIDGTIPTESSPSIPNNGTITVTRSLTIKAKAWRGDATPSDVVTAVFVIDPNTSNPTTVVEKPSADPSTGTIASALPVALNCPTAGATIRYTTDGKEPRETSMAYTGTPIALTDSTVLKFRAYKTGMNPSPTVTCLYPKIGADSDFDGIPDTWEVEHGADMFRIDANEESSKPYAHGLSNRQVFENPSVLLGDNYSTANDGIPDWWKIKYGYALTAPLYGSAGENGMTLQDAYKQLYDPKDPNSNPSALSTPNCHFAWGPNCEFFLIIHSIDPSATKMVVDFWSSTFPQQNYSVTIQSPHQQVIPLPMNLLPIGSQYGINIKAVNNEERSSKSVLVTSEYFEQARHLAFIDYSSDLKQVAKIATSLGGLRASPAYQTWRFPNPTDKLSLIGLPTPHDPEFGVPIDDPNYQPWVDSQLGVQLPRESVPNYVFSGSYQVNHVTSFGRRFLYGFPDASFLNAAADQYYLADELQLTQGSENQGVLHWGAAFQKNRFELYYDGFRFEYPGVTVDLLNPGSSVAFELTGQTFETLRATPPNVFQSVEPHSFQSSEYLFGIQDYDWWLNSSWRNNEAFNYNIYEDVVSVKPFPVMGPNNVASASPTIFFETEITKRLTAWLKMGIKRASGEVIQGQFVYIQQYFDKAFYCGDDVSADVPRTTEDNLGGKKKINQAQATLAADSTVTHPADSALLSPYGDFTPFKEGKYILTTRPDEDGFYGECAVYVISSGVFTRDPDTGIVLPVDDTIFSSAPIPDVDLRLISATINSAGDLQVQVSAKVIDRLSEVADDVSERLQELKFFVNGQPVHTVNNLPALSPGNGVMPWQPHRLDVTIPYIFTIANPVGAFILRAESSQNAAGNIGWDEVGVGVKLDEVPFNSTSEPLTITFSQPITDGSIDNFQIYFEDRVAVPGDPSCTESGLNTLIFNGNIKIENEIRPCEVILKGPITFDPAAIDHIYGLVTYQLPGGALRKLAITSEEDAPNSLRFVSSTTSAASVLPSVAYIEELAGSAKGSFDPILVSFDLPDELENSEEFTVSVNDVLQTTKPFTFSPQKIYMVLRGDDSKPRLLVVLDVEDGLPPGLNALRPDNLRWLRNGRVVIDAKRAGTPLVEAKVAIVEDEFGVKPGHPGVQQELTLPVLLTYYRIIYGQQGMNILGYYLSGLNAIELGDVLGDLDIDFPLRLGNDVAIQIEEDIDPITAANYLWSGLYRSLPWWNRNNIIPDLELDLYLATRLVVGQTAAEVGVSAANLYLSGIGIISDPVDFVITVNDVVFEKQYAAAIGFLPFVPAGAKYVWKRTDGTVIHTFTHTAVAEVNRILGKATRIERLENFRQALKQGIVTPEMMDAFIAAGPGKGIGPYTKSYERKLLTLELEKAKGARPSKNHQAHHDFPIEDELMGEWLRRGIDPNKADYGRWVKKTIKGSDEGHQTWTYEFAEGWKRWLRDNPAADADACIQHMYELRRSGRYGEVLPSELPLLN
jgi:hypothetical protein